MRVRQMAADGGGGGGAQSGVITGNADRAAAPSTTTAGKTSAAASATALIAPPPLTARGGAGGGGSRRPTLQPHHTQWAHDVRGASSQRDEDAFGAHQLVGPPRVYPMYGAHVAGGWQPLPAGGGKEGGGSSAWFEVELKSPMYISAVEIFETYAVGSVVSIALWSLGGINGTAGAPNASERGGDGQGEASMWDVVWRGDPQTATLAREARLFAPALQPRGYATRFLRVELNVAAAAAGVGGRPGGGGQQPSAAPQIDAVRAIGMRAPSDAAASAPPPRPGGGVTIGRKAVQAESEPGRPGSPPRTGSGTRPYYNEPGSPSSTFVEGPRFRAAEAEIARLRAGHAHEMGQMRIYVETLRAYGESLRQELEAANRELAARPLAPEPALG